MSGDRPKADRPGWAEINTLSSEEEYGMPMDSVARSLAALNPQDRRTVDAEPRDERERLAAARESGLEADAELDTLDELSPTAAEAEAARRVPDRGDG
ncbi:hypothetical protein [Streptomyces sp. NPDC002580]|uniref:hypothetical protein n=1 Tax=Streptomyces sp. NPDC002580 TaxID=3364653 RepID=UPI0036CFAFEE